MDVGDPPAKPPRGVKNSRETSSLLMSIIRTLSASESNEQRDEERAKLEKEYKKSDQHLEHLVSVHHHDLMVVMKLFGHLSSVVSSSRQRVRKVKENLNSCKKLLTGRREELKRLWVEGIEHAAVLQLLQEIEQIKDIPYQLGNELAQKRFLNATKLLMSAIKLSNTTLKDVSALYEIKSTLQAKKKQLHGELVKELNEQIYVNYTQDVVQFRRQGSLREHDDRGLSPLQRITVRRKSSRSSPYSKARKQLNFFTNHVTTRNAQKDETEWEDDTERVITTLVECVLLLDMLQVTLEELKNKTQSELLSLVLRTSKEMLQSDAAATSLNNNNDISTDVLVEFFKTIIEQFQRIVDAHKFILLSFATKTGHPVNIYNISDIWYKIQYVMQILLTDYLDIQNLKKKMEGPVNPAAYLDNYDVTILYTKKKPQRFVRGKFYRFEINRELYSQVSELDSYHRDKVLLFRPSPRNITAIYTPLNQFIEDIEKATGCSREKPCMLNVFVNEFVRDVFLGNHYNEVTSTVENVIKSTDSWRAITNTYQNIPLSKPLLSSCVKVVDILRDVVDLMQTLPSHRKHFVALVKKTLYTYKDACYATYRSIVSPHQDNNRQMKCAAWLKDPEIKSCIKSLFTTLDSKNVSKSEKSPLRVTVTENDEKYRKESRLLINSVSDSGVSQQEIISDVGQLKCLALLQESMEWVSCRLSELVSCVCISSDQTPPKHSVMSSLAATASPPLITVQDVDQETFVSNNNQAFYQLRDEFYELASSCLMILHLEVRSQCFYYLVPKITISSNGSRLHCQNSLDDPDPKVLELSRALALLDEGLSPLLQPKKVKFIFEGLGTLVTRILLSWTNMMERVDQILVHKICRNVYTLQQTLSTITGNREISLDRAKQYFHLFYLTPQEILNEISEKGPQFSEREYRNIFQLVRKSCPEFSEESTLQVQLRKLSELFAESGVIV